MKNTILSLSIVSTLLFATGAATAQPRDHEPTRDAAAAAEGLDVTLSGGYLRGGGDLADTAGLAREVSGGGLGGELGIGYRVTPSLVLGAYGTLSGFDGAGDDIATWSAGVKGEWHVRPAAQVDPWVSLGAGVKALWAGDHESLDRKLLGIDLAKAQLGVDYRFGSMFAIGPVIGASATLYTHEESEMTTGYDAITDRNVSYAFTAGLQGRFDYPGRR